MDVLIEGIVGSQAYGLATADSDVDMLGIYAAPTVEFHGLNPPLNREATVVQRSPDIVYHEALKYVSLCLKCNPSVTELMWLDDYTVMTPLGMELGAIRRSFLSARAVRQAYFGYAMGQFQRLRDTGEFESKVRARKAKHGRHLLRLLHQGFELYRSGHLTIKVVDPGWYMYHGEKIANDPNHAKQFLHETEQLFDSVETPLPAAPDVEVVEAWLRRVRAAFFTPLLEATAI